MSTGAYVSCLYYFFYSTPFTTRINISKRIIATRAVRRVQGGDGVLQLDCYFESSLVSCAATGKRAQAEAFGVPANKILIVDAGNFSNCAPHTHTLAVGSGFV